MKGTSMEYKIRQSDGIAILEVSGSLDTASAESAEEKFQELLSSGAKKILVNAKGLDFIASSGLRVIMATGNKLAKVDGEIRLCNLNATVNDVFVMSSLDTIYKIFDTESEALKDF